MSRTVMTNIDGVFPAAVLTTARPTWATTHARAGSTQRGDLRLRADPPVERPVIGCA